MMYQGSYTKDRIPSPRCLPLHQGVANPSVPSRPHAARRFVRIRSL